MENTSTPAGGHADDKIAALKADIEALKLELAQDRAEMDKMLEQNRLDFAKTMAELDSIFQKRMDELVAAAEKAASERQVAELAEKCESVHLG